MAPPARMNPTPRRGVLVTAVTVSAALLLAACGGADEPAPAGGGQASPGYPRTIQHAMGETKLDRQPQTVAALDGSFVDAAIALETKVVAFSRYSGLGDRLPDYLGADARTYAADAKPIGDLESPDPELLFEIKPDVVVSAKVRHEKFYDKFSAAAPTVFSGTTGSVWKDNIRLLGKVLGKEALAEQKITAYQERAARIGGAIRGKLGKVPTASVVRFVAGEPTVRLYSSASFPGIVLADMGLTRPAGQPDSTSGISVNLSQEQITALDADAVFVSTWNDPKNESKDVKAAFQGNPLWSRLTGRVVEVDDRTWVSSVSLQGANAMLTDIARHFGVPEA